MPLFGKKKEKDEKSEKKMAGYPQQASAPQYPQQSYPQAPMQQPQGYPTAQQGYAAGGAPPPYTPTAQPQMAPPPAGYGQPPPGGYYRPPGPQQTVVVQGAFDPGARFDGIAQPNIPPPPPGCAPNAAQMAAASGANVVATQQPGNFWTGGSDGGYTWW